MTIRREHTIQLGKKEVSWQRDIPKKSKLISIDNDNEGRTRSVTVLGPRMLDIEISNHPEKGVFLEGQQINDESLTMTKSVGKLVYRRRFVYSE